MSRAQLEPLVRHVRALADTENMRKLSDGEVLRHFVASRNEAAFAELLRRYGRLVQSVCRRVLGNEQDAEDAFQATFFVLARRGGSIRKSRSAAAWLYRVAQRIAMKARKDTSKRRLRQEHASTSPPAEPPTEAALRELQAILHEEMDRLPEKYRAPFLLCCIEGKSGADAALQLGWKEGTVSGRLCEARKLLKRRLARRGVIFPAAACAVYLSQSAVNAAVPVSLIRLTLKAGLMFAAGQTPTSGMISTQALALADGLLQITAAAKLFSATALLLVLGSLGLGLAYGHTLLVGAAPPSPQFANATQEAGQPVPASVTKAPKEAPLARDRFCETPGNPSHSGRAARTWTEILS